MAYDVVAGLLTAQQNIITNLISMTTTFKPTYNIDGQDVKWAELFKNYIDALDLINQAIAEAAPTEYQTISNWP